jgi:hypothetical protein
MKQPLYVTTPRRAAAAGAVGCLLLAAALAGCASTPAATAPASNSAAAEAVQRYLEARIAGDADALARLLCAEREGDARREAASFAAVEASLKDVACAFDPATVTVACSGAIVAVYDGEGRDIEIPRYRVAQEDGEWKVCGEA